MSKIRFRSLSSPAFSVAVSHSGAKAELSTTSGAEIDPIPPQPEPAPEPEPTPEPEPGPEPAPADPSLSATIKANRSKGTAPAGMFFDVTLSGFDALDVPLQDALVVWDFGDPGSRFADLSGRLDMLNKMDPTQLKWNDANKAYGFLVSHVFRKPGTYSVSCSVYYSLANAPVKSNAITMTVTEPDQVFGTANTIYASNGSDFTGVPVGAKKITTSDLNQLWLAASSPRRIKLKRGDTFAAPTGAKGSIGTTLIEDWGDAGNPRPTIDVTNTALAFRDKFSELMVRNVVLQGDYRSESNSGTVTTGLDFYSSFEGAAVFDNVAIRNCGKSGVSASNLNGNPGSSVCFIDVDVTEWLNYGIYGKFFYAAFLGTWIHANPKGFKHNPNSGGGSGMRIEAFGTPTSGGAYFSCADVFMNYAGRFTGDQPGYKVQGDSVKDSRWVWDRVITEGSTDTSHGVGSTTPDRQFALIDKHIHIGTAQCGLPLSIQQGGTTVRNYYYIQPHVANEKLDIKGINNNYALNLNPAGGTADNLNSWFYTYGCTAVHWGDIATQTDHRDNYKMVNNEKAFAKQVTSNNVIHAPFDLTPQEAEVDVSAGGTGFVNYAGRRWPGENDNELQTQYAPPQTFSFGRYTNQPTVCVTTPKGANLAASTGAGQKIPFDYIDGTLRGAKPAKGAFKP